MNAQEVNMRLENIIFHIDVNSAYLSWEAVYRLAHKGERQEQSPTDLTIEIYRAGSGICLMKWIMKRSPGWMIRWKGESKRWHLESVRILPGQMQAVSEEHRKESAVSAGLPVPEGLCP